MRMTLCAAHHRPAFRTFFDGSMSLPGVEEAQCPWSWRLWLWLEAPALACGDVAALMAGSEVAAAVGVVVVEVPGFGGVDGLAAPHAHRLPGGDEGCEAGSEFLVRRAVAAGRG